jgi:hypothetical protein
MKKKHLWWYETVMTHGAMIECRLLEVLARCGTVLVVWIP